MSVRQSTMVHRAVRDALIDRERVVLAVSGGLDSMTLLHAAATALPHERMVVATFDHGTGDAAVRARRLVTSQCEERHLECVVGHATEPLTTEADFRAARWAFLRGVAATARAPIVTAHTESDQVETVLMRVLRDSGGRGLAGLYAATDVIRPFVGLTRRDLTNYARVCGVSWIDDPSNESRRFLRNRVRHDILPALRRAHPGIAGELLAVARRAAAWRFDVDAFVSTLEIRATLDRGLDVPADSLIACAPDQLAVLWPAIAARAGVILDRRGTVRLAEFTKTGRTGARIQLAGGWNVVRSRDAFELRASPDMSLGAVPMTPAGMVRWGSWSFHPSSTPIASDAWSALLPSDRPLTVRPWEHGDAMTLRPGRDASKVKRLLSKAGVTGHDRATWPVVLAGDQIVWIPGVSRSDAAPARSGRPGLPFRCEYRRP